MSNRKKLALLGILRFIALCLPIVILVAVSWDKYIQVKGGVTTLTVSGVVGIVLFGFQAASKFPKNVNSGLKWGIVTFTVWLLDPLVADLFAICLAITIGQIGYAILTPFYNAAYKTLDRAKNTQALTDALKNVDSGGRV